MTKATGSKIPVNMLCQICMYKQNGGHKGGGQWVHVHKPDFEKYRFLNENQLVKCGTARRSYPADTSNSKICPWRPANQCFRSLKRETEISCLLVAHAQYPHQATTNLIKFHCRLCDTSSLQYHKSKRPLR